MRDPVCMGACCLYALNKWVISLSLKGPFLRNHFNDTLLIPAALPLALWVHMQIGIRPADENPKWSEILLHLAVWSVACEVVAPHIFTNATGDPWDIVAYAAGALISGVFWQGK